MERKHFAIPLVVLILIAIVTSACGKTKFPYPEDWVVENKKQNDSDSNDNNEQAQSEDKEGNGTEDEEEKEKQEKWDVKEVSGEEDEKSAGQSEDTEGSLEKNESLGNESSTDKPIAAFFLDSSGSMNRMPEINTIHAYAQKACPGYQRKYYFVKKEKATEGEEKAEKEIIAEAEEEMFISGHYDNNVGAVLDLLETETIPISVDGLNILTTDLQTKTSCSKIGAWLVDTGCSGISLYVFSVKNENNVDFYGYTSSTQQKKEKISVLNCNFQRDFLMIVFGDDGYVRNFDEEFQQRLPENIKFESCHVSHKDAYEDVDSLLKLVPSREFKKNLANITYESTRYLYGLRLKETEDIDFSLENTFVFVKNKYSVYKDEKKEHKNDNSAKIYLYGIPDQDVEIPEMTDDVITVLEYDEKEKKYIESDMSFTVSEEAFLNGIPVADDPKLNEELGGNLVSDNSPAILITIENRNLLPKLYAVDIVLIGKTDIEPIDIKRFAREHSAGLEEYNSALKTECEPLKNEDGKKSKKEYSRTAEGESVFSKLLEFERIVDELNQAKYVTDNGEKAIRIRAIIDFR